LLIEIDEQLTLPLGNPRKKSAEQDARSKYPQGYAEGFNENLFSR